MHNPTILFLQKDQEYPNLILSESDIFFAFSMARLSPLSIILLVIIASFMSTLEGRKLLNTVDKETIPSVEGSLVVSALPKGTVTPSSPSKKSHGMVVNEQLFARHLAAIDRILRSVPSPGAGH